MCECESGSRSVSVCMFVRLCLFESGSVLTGERVSVRVSV